MPSPFSFRKHGESGIEVSEIFPHVAKHVDEIAFLRSVYGRSNDHVQATYEMQTGQLRMGFPSVGAWVTYGLGSESSSLPAYVVMNDHRGGPLGGPNDWGAGFLPASYQGTLFRTAGEPISLMGLVSEKSAAFAASRGVRRTGAIMKASSGRQAVIAHHATSAR